MWNKNLLLSCFIVISFVAFIQCNDDEFKCFELGKRPKVMKIIPSSKGALPGTTAEITLARHHIIPYNFLRTFFNFAASAKDVSSVLRSAINEEIKKILKTYVNDKKVVSANLCKAIAGKDQHDTAIRALQIFYTWLPGNIFYGPEGKYRSDDPADFFERDSYEIIGDEYYKDLGNLYVQMVNFVESPKFRSVNFFKRITKGLQSLFKDRSPFEYIQQQWEKDPKKAGKYRIQRVEREDEIKLPKEPIEPKGADCFAAELVEITKSVGGRCLSDTTKTEL